MGKEHHAPAAVGSILHLYGVLLSSLPMQLGRRLMNIEAIFRRPRGGGANRLRSEGEVDTDRSCHILIRFLVEKLQVVLP